MNRQIYLVEKATLKLIPDLDTFNALGLKPNDVIPAWEELLKKFPVAGSVSIPNNTNAT